jgi:hypothetical protein
VCDTPPFGRRIGYAQDLSAQEAATQKGAWFFKTDENKERASGTEKAAQQESKKAICIKATVAWLFLSVWYGLQVVWLAKQDVPVNTQCGTDLQSKTYP